MHAYGDGDWPHRGANMCTLRFEPFLQHYIFPDDENSKNLCLCRNFAINYQGKIIMTIKMILIIIIIIKENDKE